MGPLKERGLRSPSFVDGDGDVERLLELREAASAAACYERVRLTSVSVLDVSVQAAIDARAREGKVRAAGIESCHAELNHVSMTYDAPLVSLKRSRRLEGDPNAWAIAGREQQVRRSKELRDLIVAAKCPIV